MNRRKTIKAAKGRPRKSEISKFRVMTWYSAVSIASGKSTSELEKQFAGIAEPAKNHEGWVSSKLWDKYRRGEAEPKLTPPKGEQISTVDRVEKVYPGTARWLSMPLWRLFDPEPIGMDGLRSVLMNLENRVSSLLILKDAPENGIFWLASTRNIQRHVETLYRIASLDAATALAVMIRLAEICQDQELHYEAYLALISVLEDAKWEEPIMRVLPLLRCYLVDKFSCVQYYSDQGKIWVCPIADPDVRGRYRAFLDERSRKKKDHEQLQLFSKEA